MCVSDHVEHVHTRYTRTRQYNVTTNAHAHLYLADGALECSACSVELRKVHTDTRARARTHLLSLVHQRHALLRNLGGGLVRRLHTRALYQLCTRAHASARTHGHQHTHIHTHLHPLPPTCAPALACTVSSCRQHTTSACATPPARVVVLCMCTQQHTSYHTQMHMRTY
jgi:hypothetical protein